MSKLSCPFGWTLSDVESPHPNMGAIITQHAEENLTQDQRISDIETIDVWECTNCGRIALVMPGSIGAHWLKREDSEPLTLLDKVPYKLFED